MAVLHLEHQIIWPNRQSQGERCASPLSPCPLSGKGDSPEKANSLLLLTSPVEGGTERNLGAQDSGGADGDGSDLVKL